MALSHGAEKIAASAELLPRRQALVTIENNEIMIAGVSLKKKKVLRGYCVVVLSLSRVRLLQPHRLQHARLPCPSLPP